MNGAARFWAKVDRRGPDECWPWMAATTGKGYGLIWWDGHLVVAHRVGFILTRGPVPDGLDLDHLCHNADPACSGGPTCAHRRCCNPYHVEPATRADNLSRGAGHGTETHCRHGHPYSGDNLYLYANGHRACRTCNRAKAARRRAAKAPRVAGPIWECTADGEPVKAEAVA